MRGGEVRGGEMRGGDEMSEWRGESICDRKSGTRGVRQGESLTCHGRVAITLSTSR